MIEDADGVSQPAYPGARPAGGGGRRGRPDPAATAGGLSDLNYTNSMDPSTKFYDKSLLPAGAASQATSQRKGATGSVALGKSSRESLFERESQSRVTDAGGQHQSP